MKKTKMLKTLKQRILAIGMVVALTVPLMIGCTGCGSAEKNLGAFKAKAKNGVIDLPQPGVK
ncbi:MAG: hypothetical protein J5518_04685 [Lachnospiraceae bacterium]|nr:hypothetical protein [Lachnospiraceae bacterium]